MLLLDNLVLAALCLCCTGRVGQAGDGNYKWKIYGHIYSVFKPAISLIYCSACFVCIAYPAQYWEAKSVLTFNIKYFNLDVVFKVPAKCTKCFVQCPGPLPQGEWFQVYKSSVVSCDGLLCHHQHQVSESGWSPSRILVFCFAEVFPDCTVCAVVHLTTHSLPSGICGCNLPEAKSSILVFTSFSWLIFL